MRMPLLRVHISLFFMRISIIHMHTFSLPIFLFCAHVSLLRIHIILCVYTFLSHIHLRTTAQRANKRRQTDSDVGGKFEEETTPL